MMNDGTSGWLSDAQDDYAVTFAAPGRKLPESSARSANNNLGQQVTGQHNHQGALSRRRGRIAVSVLGQDRT